MKLLRSSAQHIFWLGRYLMRMQYMCQHLPFEDDAQAQRIAHVFCLPAYDAASLNALLFNPEQGYSMQSHLQMARDNILELRGILTAKGYAELNAHIQNAMQNPTTQMCNVVIHCMTILENELADVFLFFSLGIKLENLDAALRTESPVMEAVADLQRILQQLATFAPSHLLDALMMIETEQNLTQFYQFSSQLDEQFEACA